MQKVFVTGGSGYVGRNLIRTLVAEGKIVHALARSDAAFAAVTKVGAIGFRGDVLDIDAMTKAAMGCDTAVHSAAALSSFGPTGVGSPSHDVNVVGTKNVLEACSAAGVTRVVHVGTEAACLPADGSGLFYLNETTPLPETPFWGTYSTTKNQAERLALSMNTPKFGVVVVRPRFIWGNDDTTLLPAFIDASRQGILRWFDGGDYLTSTCHVDNVVEGIVLAAIRGRPGHSYFLTDGNPVKFRVMIKDMFEAVDEVAPPDSAWIPFRLVWWLAAVGEWVCGVAGCSPPVTRQELAVVGQEIVVHDAKARQELGYVGKVSMAEGMQDLRRRHELDIKTRQARRHNEL